MLYPFSRLCRPARSPASCGPAARKKRRGFNLIEAAIVLGVVGLVIGGIWVAAASVLDNWKLSETISGTLVLAQNTQRLISISDAVPLGNAFNMSSTLLSMQAYPAGWKNQISPLNTSTPVFSYIAGYFDIYFYSVPRSLCIKLVTGITSRSGAISNGGVEHVSIWNSTWVGTLYTTTIPVTLATAKVGCSDITNYIAFRFPYTRIN
jgi:hypothetical protein